MRPRSTWGFSGIMAAFLLPVVMFLAHHQPAAQPARSGHVASAPVIQLATQHVAVPGWYTVQPGDTLSSVSARFYGHASRWPALWWSNRHWVHNPDALAAGLRLHLVRWHPDKTWLASRAMAAVPKPPPAPAPVASGGSPDPAGAANPAPAAPAGPSPVSATPVSAGAAPGSFQSCVITRESGGNPSAVNASSGAGGLYGFLPSTWQALGHSGLPENASVAEQNQAFAQEYAQSGGSAWSAYDGC